MQGYDVESASQQSCAVSSRWTMDLTPPDQQSALKMNCEGAQQTEHSHCCLQDDPLGQCGNNLLHPRLAQDKRKKAEET